MRTNVEIDPGDSLVTESHSRIVDGQEVQVAVLLPQNASPELRNTEVIRAVSEECFRTHGVGRLVRTVNGLSYVRADFPHRRKQPSVN